MRILHTEVAPAEAGESVRRILKRRFGFADSLLSHLKFSPGAVLRNGAPVRLVDRAAAGDALTVKLTEKHAAAFARVALPLCILYEDEDLLLLDKPAGVAVHGAGGGAPTLGNALAAYWGEDTPFHPVNRLDKGTSGVMAVAKSRYVHDRLRQRLHSEDFCRTYIALAAGRVTPERGVIDGPIAKAPGAPTKRTVSPEGKPARTRYETLAVGEDWTLLRIRPETGRTHQIRVHFASIGHPLLGDRLYGTADGRIDRPALHSASLTLRQPVTGETISVTAPLPEDMERLLGDAAAAQLL